MEAGKMKSWQLSQSSEQILLASSERSADGVKAAFARTFEFKVPLAMLLATPLASSNAPAVATRLRLRFSLWQNRLPVDALPLEGWIELQLLSEQDLAALAF
jgi:hypothetical protein